jgi:GNAT superfamily N-acetyltransferase
MDPEMIPERIRGSYPFAVAVDTTTGRSVGMGRVISDGVGDAYIQDLAVLPRWVNRGVGSAIVSALLYECKSGGIGWIGLIAQPGTDSFYRSLGFETSKGHKPMLFHEK